MRQSQARAAVHQSIEHAGRTAARSRRAGREAIPARAARWLRAGGLGLPARRGHSMRAIASRHAVRAAVARPVARRVGLAAPVAQVWARTCAASMSLTAPRRYFSDKKAEEQPETTSGCVTLVGIFPRHPFAAAAADRARDRRCRNQGPVWESDGLRPDGDRRRGRLSRERFCHCALRRSEIIGNQGAAPFCKRALLAVRR